MKCNRKFVRAISICFSPHPSSFFYRPRPFHFDSNNCNWQHSFSPSLSLYRSSFHTCCLCLNTHLVVFCDKGSLRRTHILTRMDIFFVCASVSQFNVSILSSLFRSLVWDIYLIMWTWKRVFFHVCACLTKVIEDSRSPLAIKGDFFSAFDCKKEANRSGTHSFIYIP